jgi:hypothetical protein
MTSLEEDLKKVDDAQRAHNIALWLGCFGTSVKWCLIATFIVLGIRFLWNAGS